MWRKFFLVFVIAIAFGSAINASEIFSYDDILEDESGAGDYVFPESDAILPGTYDLQNIKIVENPYTIDFSIKLSKSFKPKNKNQFGWDLQIFDVYLNFGIGNHKYAISGRNLKIKEGWDKAILIVPEEKETVQKRIESDNSEVTDIPIISENLVEDIVVPEKVVVRGSVLTASVDKKKLLNVNSLAGIQVVVMEYEGVDSSTEELLSSKNTFCVPVLKDSSEFGFGGGTDYHGNPNVIDILDDNYLLGKYKSERDVIDYASISLIPLKK